MIIPKKALGATLVVAVLLAAAYFLFLARRPAPADAAAAPAAGAAAAPGGLSAQDRAEAAPIPVKAVAAKRGDLVIRLKSPGEAFSDRRVVMKAEVRGAVKDLPAREGLRVKAGDVLLRIDDREYQLNLENVNAERIKSLSSFLMENQFAEPSPGISRDASDKVKAAQQAFAKADAAFREGLVSRRDYQKAQREWELALIDSGQRKEEVQSAVRGLTQSQVGVEKAQMELDRTVVRAPFGGILTDVKVSPGEQVEAGRELFTLVDIGTLRVRARVLESEIGKMKTGRSVGLRFTAYPGRVFPGVVEAISPIVNPDDRTCAVYVSLRNPGEEIKPGMHAEVEIDAEIHRDRLLVPQAAVLVRGGRKLVFVVEGGLAKWRYVQVGLESEDFAEILPAERPEETVREGESVITDGHFTLAHDARVAVKD